MVTQLNKIILSPKKTGVTHSIAIPYNKTDKQKILAKALRQKHANIDNTDATS